MNAAPTIPKGTEILYRFAEVDCPAMERARKKTLRVAFSSETPVLRFENGENYWEVLDHDPENADITLLQDGGAFVDEHDWSQQIGSVERAWLDASDRKGRADLSFADTDLGNERWKLMSGGFRKDISFGYTHTKKLSETTGDQGFPLRRFAWQAYEITSTAVGADHFGTGVGRSQMRSQMKRSIMQVTDKMTDENQITAFAEEFSKDRPDLADDISTLKARAFAAGETKRDFAKSVHTLFERKPAPQNFRQAFNRELGMSGSEINTFSFSRALKSAIENAGNIGGYEREVSQSVEKQTGQRSEGIWIPGDLVLGGPRRSYTRDMFTGDFSSGGAVVPTMVAQPIIELLRNKVVCSRLGATILAGLTGNVAIPREIAPSTASAVSEIGQVNNSDVLLDQVRLQPHRISCQVIYSRQLILQSAPDVESFIRNDMFSVMAIKHDSMLLQGSGAADEPLGLFNQLGINSVIFGGTPTWYSIVGFETALAKMNVGSDRRGWATTPASKGRLKGIAVALAGASTVSSRPLWGPGNFADDPSDGLMNGYRAAATNQIPSDRVCFANWSELVYGQWSGFELITDIFSRAARAEIVVTLNSWIDCALRHPQAFTVSADSAVQ
jgi:HK97 family phage major capsid protein